MSSIRRVLLSAGLILFLTIGLTGAVRAENTAAATTTLFYTPLELDFGPVGVGQTSPPLTVKITNTGSALLTDFAGGGVSAPFSGAQNCAGGIDPGATCEYQFQFSPTVAGNFSTNSYTTTNGGSIIVRLTGQGVAALAVVAAHDLDFGSVYLPTPPPGATPAPVAAATQVVTIRNAGLARLVDWAGGGVNGPFSAAQNCAGGVDPGQSCQFTFGFAPSVVGTYTATSSTVADGSPVIVRLSGAGRQTLTGSQQVSPRSLDFGPVGVGVESPALVVTITNQSGTAITAWAGGVPGAPFIATQNCAGGVPPGGSCTFSYTFKPTQTGIFNATSTVANSAGGFTINLTGTGVAASQTANFLSLDFGPVPPGATSEPQVVTIHNTGLVPLTSWAGGAPGGAFSATQNCAGGVAPGATCNFTYRFIPTSDGVFSAISSISTNAGPIRIHLRGGPIQPLYLPGIYR